MCQRRCRCTPSSAPPRRNVIGSQEYYQARGFPSLQNDNEAKPSLQHVVRRSEELQVFGRRSNVDIELVKEESEENKQVSKATPPYSSRYGDFWFLKTKMALVNMPPLHEASERQEVTSRSEAEWEQRHEQLLRKSPSAGRTTPGGVARSRSASNTTRGIYVLRYHD
ncbi:Hypothetical protein SMAX5B_020620 [Scophthalmus maximus]|uniref:Uncharacterized protein n=1 Tax=Scophthalmus maximus TaxID=52904 RepID=A0A2U9CNI8_SCOMX|nr:Hypothetical protein SMAX5B_020620 [Scophthalmus maximus]